MAKKKLDTDNSTEEKIMEAARKVFTQKGYAGTRTRDIVEEAGINLALLNYYFRSKEKLFEIIMTEKVQQLFGVIAPIVMDPSSSLDEKVAKISEGYLTMLSLNPDLPLFVMSEIRNNPEFFASKIKVMDLANSTFIKQLHEARPDIHPIHFLMNILGLCVFPFISKPVFQTMGILDEQMFKKIIEERKAFIPRWIKAMLNEK